MYLNLCRYVYIYIYVSLSLALALSRSISSNDISKSETRAFIVSLTAKTRKPVRNQE